jgi:hypothetical protein
MFSRFFFVFLMIFSLMAGLPLVWPAYGHDCPLQNMGTLEKFRALDQDKNRRLSLAEFMDQSWCQEVPSCQCQEAARQFFTRLDQNGDGFVDLEEFTGKPEKRQRKRKSQTN